MRDVCLMMMMCYGVRVEERKIEWEKRKPRTGGNYRSKFSMMAIVRQKASSLRPPSQRIAKKRKPGKEKRESKRGKGKKREKKIELITGNTEDETGLKPRR